MRWNSLIIKPPAIPTMVHREELRAVTSRDSILYRRAVHTFAKYLQQECKFDCPPYSVYHMDLPELQMAYLFVDVHLEDRLHHSPAFGACVFSRERINMQWHLNWVWLHPFYRRRKHLSHAWPIFKKRFGDFICDGPFSLGAKKFLEKQGVFDEAIRQQTPDV